MGMTVREMGNSSLSADKVRSNYQKGMNAYKKSSKSSNKKVKRLQYNPREISSQIMRASRLQSASQVLVRAKGKLASVLRCKGTGQYNEEDIRIASLHASKMVKCARKKVENLREEDLMKRRSNKRKNQAEYENDKNAAVAKRNRKKSQKMTHVRSKVAREKLKQEQQMKEKQLEVQQTLQQSQEIIEQKQESERLIKRRRLHRNEENTEITEADMKYLGAKLKQAAKEVEQGQSGVLLELSSQAMRWNELQFSARELKMLEKRIEEEIERQFDMEGGMESYESSEFFSASPSGVQGSVPSEAMGELPSSSVDTFV